MPCFRISDVLSIKLVSKKFFCPNFVKALNDMIGIITMS